jgi:hypothetical protein
MSGMLDLGFVIVEISLMVSLAAMIIDGAIRLHPLCLLVFIPWFGLALILVDVMKKS